MQTKASVTFSMILKCINVKKRYQRLKINCITQQKIKR